MKKVLSVILIALGMVSYPQRSTAMTLGECRSREADLVKRISVAKHLFYMNTGSNPKLVNYKCYLPPDTKYPEANNSPAKGGELIIPTPSNPSEEFSEYLLGATLTTLNAYIDMLMGNQYSIQQRWAARDQLREGMSRAFSEAQRANPVTKNVPGGQIDIRYGRITKVVGVQLYLADRQFYNSEDQLVSRSLVVGWDGLNARLNKGAVDNARPDRFTNPRMRDNGLGVDWGTSSYPFSLAKERAKSANRFELMAMFEELKATHGSPNTGFRLALSYGKENNDDNLYNKLQSEITRYERLYKGNSSSGQDYTPPGTWEKPPWLKRQLKFRKEQRGQ